MNKDILERYQTIDWNKLLRKDLGEHSLEAAKEDLDKIKKIFDDILNYPNVENLSENFTNIVQNQLQRFVQFAKQIVNDFQDIAQRQVWISNIKNEEYEVFNNLLVIYNYIQTFDPSKDEKLKEQVKKSEDRIVKLNEDLSKTENLLQNAQKQATKVEVQSFGNLFGEEAEKNKKSAKNNFWIMIGSIILTATLAIIFLPEIGFTKIKDASFLDNLLSTITSQNIILRFVIISLGAYLIAHFAKVHAAEQHLYNLNTQRQHALNSHKQILDSVIATESENEKEIRNAILLELTRAIFESKDTGYLKNPQNPSATNQIVEVSRTLTK